MTSIPRTVSDQPAPPIGDGPVRGLPKPTERRRRPLLVIVGVLVAALAATLVAVTLNAVTQTQLVWQTSVSVVRGEPVTEDQLEPVAVPLAAADTLLSASVESQGALTDGLVWSIDLPSGQLLSEPLMVDRLPIDPGQALVGLRLEPGGFPIAGLQPGDAVRVVGTDDGDATTSAPPVLVERATVEAVAALADQGPSSPRLVTVQVPADRAAAVAAAGMAGQVSLAVVP